MFAQWPSQLAARANIQADDRVLDVGCGTGVLAREAARHCAHADNVTGLDLNESMLAVAKGIAPQIKWRQGDMLKLPFSDNEYDVVASQFVLMFVPDRVAALREMWRVLAPGGRLVVAVWSDSLAYAELAVLARAEGAEAVAESVEVPFSLGNEDELLGLFSAAAITDPRLETCDGWVRFASIDEFIRVEIKGWVMADSLEDAVYERLLTAARQRLRNFCEASGEIVFPMNAHLITARKS